MIKSFLNGQYGSDRFVFHQSLIKILENTTQIEPNSLLIKFNQVFLKVQNLLIIFENFVKGQ